MSHNAIILILILYTYTLYLYFILIISNLEYLYMSLLSHGSWLDAGMGICQASVISNFNVVSVMVGFSFLTWVLVSYLHKILSHKSIKWNDTEMVDIPGPVSPC